VNGKRPGPNDKKVYFPIAKDIKGFEKKLKDYQLAILPTRTREVLEDTQPFTTRPDNRWLWCLQELSNESKHRNILAPSRLDVVRSSGNPRLGKPEFESDLDNCVYDLVVPADNSFFLYLITFSLPECEGNGLEFLKGAIERTEKLASRLIESL
jgi:hypothetical protein